MKSSVRTFLIITSLLLLTYTAIRGIKLSFTHDESFTYLYSAQNSIPEILSNRTELVSANNHILNTLSMKFFDRLLGNDEIFLRLQSLLAHICYLLFTYLLLRNFKSTFVIVTGFIILNFNPYLLEFFSLARGYALSISFMLISIYFFDRYLREENNRHLSYSFIAGSFAVLSNFALINYFVSVLFILQIIIYWKYRDVRTNFIKSKNVFLILMVLVMVCYEPVRKLIKFNSFDFGGTRGILKDTVESQIGTFLYKQPYTDNFFRTIEIFIILSVVVYAIIILTRIYKRKMNEDDKTGSFIFSALLLILASNSVQHYTLGSPYLMERFALFISPLYLLALIYLLNDMVKKGRALKLTGIFLLLLISGSMIYHFNNCANLSYSTNWDYEADTENMINDLIKEKEKSGKKTVRLGITWLYEPTVNFYRITKKLDWLEKAERKGIGEGYDFIFYYPFNEEEAEKVKPLNKTLIKKYPVSKSELYILHSL
jgi:hypothetical protein